MFLMCDPRQQFFQCGPEMAGHPCLGLCHLVYISVLAAGHDETIESNVQESTLTLCEVQRFEQGLSTTTLTV